MTKYYPILSLETRRKGFVPIPLTIILTQRSFPRVNMKWVKECAGKLMQKSGLTAEDLTPFQSPKGYYLLHALINL